jgi:hypothetical protein
MFSTLLSRCLAFAATLILLASCTVVVDEPGPRPGPIQTMCPSNHDPVCARNGGSVRTFANSCMADAAGYRVTHRGECRRASEPPRACTFEYVPVCGESRGERRTFSNSCLADQAGFRVTYQGACGRGGGNSQSQFCAPINMPVCARRGHTLRSFPNACEARAADYRVINRGPC